VDAVRIAEAIDEGLLHVASVRSRRKLPLALGRGEAAAIRLFLQERADLLLTDDGRAIRTSRTTSSRGTPQVSSPSPMPPRN